MSWTLTTSGSAVLKAGNNADLSISGSALASWSDMAEGRIVAETRRDWVTDYTGLGTEIKGILNDIASSLIAKNIISYDLPAYTRAEAQTLLDVNDDIARAGLKVLKDFKSNDIKST